MPSPVTPEPAQHLVPEPWQGRRFRGRAPRRRADRCSAHRGSGYHRGDGHGLAGLDLDLPGEAQMPPPPAAATRS